MKILATFLVLAAILVLGGCGCGCAGKQAKSGIIMTVRGEITPDKLGKTLPHEHVLVDFIGADKVSKDRYNSAELVEVMFPYLKDLRESGFDGFIDCTPMYLARDVEILRHLSEITGLHIVTNTGYYGAVNDKYVPAFAYKETAEQIAARWIKEWRNGIEGTNIRPGFVKTAVDSGALSDIDRKLIEAAAITHLKTGMTIACHTGETQAALAVLETIKKNGVDPSALIIVHANGIADANVRMKIAKEGVWLEYDGVNKDSIAENIRLIKEAIDAGLIDRLLISQDAGCYLAGDKRGGEAEGKIKPFTVIAEQLIPAMQNAGLSDEQINKLIVDNPAKAFTIKIRKLDLGKNQK
jgi:phosphotriesterase-related protein